MAALKRHVMKPFKSAISILSAIILFQSIALGDDTVETREALRGLKSIYVGVSLGGGIRRAGLSESMLQSEVEQKLTSAGIDVISKSERDDVIGTPWLSLTVEGNNKEGSILYTVELSLRQDAYLVRNFLTVGVVTWSVGRFGLTYKTETIRSSVKELTDKFINAYFWVNPKK
jgi:hypothetical protein